MSISKPFKRTVRIYQDGKYSDNGRGQYVSHKAFSQEPEHYVRAFLIIQKDFIHLLDYIEPSDANLSTYSFRIHELLLRTCIEVEANCVAILRENIFTKTGDWNMSDYKKINQTHRLSSYEVQLPIWQGSENTRRPFTNWNSGQSLPWYKAYNTTKHDRHTSFVEATFRNLTDAICGLTVILASQFMTEDFSHDFSIGGSTHSDGFETAIGQYFRIKFPLDWPQTDRYDFNWKELKCEDDPFDKYNYD